MPKKLPKKSKKQTTVKTQKKPILTSNIQARVQAYNKHGITLAGQDKLAEAAQCFQQALQYNPNDALTHNNLGIILSKQNQLTKAITCYQRAIEIRPNYPEAFYNLGNTLREQGQIDQAIEAYQKAITLIPYANMLLNLGNLLQERQKFSEAIECYQRALNLNPIDANIYLNLGIVFRKQNKLIDAIEWFQRALSYQPNLAEAHYNLGLVLEKRSQLTQAVEHYQRAVDLKPNDIAMCLGLGNIFRQQSQLTKAINYLQRTITLKPEKSDLTKAYYLLGVTLSYQGMINEAIKQIKKSLEITQTNVIAHQCLMMTLNYTDSLEPSAIFAEHQRFNEQHAKPLATSIQPHLNESTPTRKLKIGYVSGDFRQHSVAYFIEPVLSNHDHQLFDIYCYYNNDKSDDFTERLQQSADHWFNCMELSDDELAHLIRQDQIDILIDLAGHTAKNRLLMFARKPAPVQVTYLGYPNTTGLDTIDYRITDNHADPENMADSFSTETLIRMPNSYFCYHPYDNSPPVSELPALKNSFITFGSFNNYAKISTKILELWIQILQRVPNSKLLIKAKSLNDPTTLEAFQKQLADLDIASERLILINYASSTESHLKTYYQVDIGLDTFPYNGATTTCEALWMGIPVVTLVGEKHVSLVGLSILSAIGLTELIAHTPEEYVEICVKLAHEIEHLQKLRAEMRERMQHSPLMDGATFTRDLEKAYRKMWEKWCTGG